MKEGIFGTLSNSSRQGGGFMHSDKEELSDYIKQELSNMPCPECQKTGHEVTSLTIYRDIAMATIYCNVVELEEEIRVYLEYV